LRAEGFENTLMRHALVCLTNNRFLEKFIRGHATLYQAFPSLSGFSLLSGTPWQNYHKF